MGKVRNSHSTAFQLYQQSIFIPHSHKIGKEVFKKAALFCLANGNDPP